MTARAVIGANFGDEGKGLVTDYLCSQGAGMVVRFNGGAQAGHTVITPEGKRHVFHHIGSGALLGVPTFLSKFFLINPIAFFEELDVLRAIGVDPVVYADPQCLITTFADMFINQLKEDQRERDRKDPVGRHGSCGMGINETINRSSIAELAITMGDLWHSPRRLRGQLEQICTRYFKFRMGKELPNHEPMIEHFIKGCEAIANALHPLGIQQCPDIVFEGAQGLLLDQNNKAMFPHLTRSNTGITNVLALCKLAGIDALETYYVSRTYLTRHGAGPFPTENRFMNFKDDTNIQHDYQGRLRFGLLDYNEMMARCAQENVLAGSHLKNRGHVVLTHADQEPTPKGAAPDLVSYGPTRNDLKAYHERALRSA